jgi:hypothetical protein
MNVIHEFRLSPPGSGRGVSCDANGAFVGTIPLLKRNNAYGYDRWEPRNCGELSKQIGSQFGLPIDLASRVRGIKAISNALNEGDVARAQIATVLLRFPNPPVPSKGAGSQSEMIKFIRELYRSELIKADWDADEHPRWPAGAPDSQGGQFAPKGTAPDTAASSVGGRDDDSADGREKGPEGGTLNDGVYHPGDNLDNATSIQTAAEWPSNGPPDELAVCGRFARLCILLAPLLLSGDTPQHVPLHDHHIFPQQFRQYFKQRNIDIDQYTVTMDAPTHLEGVHGAGTDGMPGQWNKAWADFIARNPSATRQQIFDFAGELMKRYGISASEIHPYGQFP